MMNRDQVVNALSLTGGLPKVRLRGGRRNHRTIYESSDHAGRRGNGHYFIDYPTFPGGSTEEVPRAVIDELEREGLIVRAFPDHPHINAWARPEDVNGKL